MLKTPPYLYLYIQYIYKASKISVKEPPMRKSPGDRGIAQEPEGQKCKYMKRQAILKIPLYEKTS